MKNFVRPFIFLIAIPFVLQGQYNGTIYAAEKDLPLLSEQEFLSAAGSGRCIILFQGADLFEQKDGGRRDSEQKGKRPRRSDPKDQRPRDNAVQVPQPFVNELVKQLLLFKERIASSVRLARVDGKGYSADTLARVRNDAALLPNEPGPVFATYDFNGAVVSRVKGPFRPDALPWLVHEIMGYYIHSIKTEKGEYLRMGWSSTDTNSSFINLVGEKKEDREQGGKVERVQVIDYVSTPREGATYRFQRMFGADGKLLGSLESYGDLGTFGYFDHDRTGRLQYRVAYPAQQGRAE
ncbi:MAG: hypothetical protein AABZ15_14575 [Nitrospirota bacterium]